MGSSTSFLRTSIGFLHFFSCKTDSATKLPKIQGGRSYRYVGFLSHRLQPYNVSCQMKLQTATKMSSLLPIQLQSFERMFVCRLSDYPLFLPSLPGGSFLSKMSICHVPNIHLIVNQKTTVTTAIRTTTRTTTTTTTTTTTRTTTTTTKSVTTTTTTTTTTHYMVYVLFLCVTRSQSILRFGVKDSHIE